MPTSSIFESFNIHDEKTMERFVAAIEESIKRQEAYSRIPARKPLTDKNKIIELWKKRNRVNNTDSGNNVNDRTVEAREACGPRSSCGDS